MIGGFYMIEKDELAYIKSRLDFWDKLSESEINLLENNIANVSYTKALIFIVRTVNVSVSCW